MKRMRARFATDHSRTGVMGNMKGKVPLVLFLSQSFIYYSANALLQFIYFLNRCESLPRMMCPSEVPGGAARPRLTKGRIMRLFIRSADNLLKRMTHGPN